MKFEVVPAHELPMAEQAAIFNQAFAGYLAGSIELDAAGLARFLCAQGADVCYSRFIREQGTAVGFGYINRTGNISRLAAMGTIPTARRTGAAAHLLSQLLTEANERGDEAMVLEVFEQNVPAVALYRRHQFRELMRLFAWRRAADDGAPKHSIDLEHISLTAASQLRSVSEFPHIPWQISRHAIAKVPVGCAYKIDNACIVIGDSDVDPIRVHGFFWNDESDWNAPRQALSAVLRKFPKHAFFAPAIFPERFGDEIFRPLVFVREQLNQFLMRKDL